MAKKKAVKKKAVPKAAKKKTTTKKYRRADPVTGLNNGQRVKLKKKLAS